MAALRRERESSNPSEVSPDIHHNITHHWRWHLCHNDHGPVQWWQWQCSTFHSDCQINITRSVHSALFVAWLDLEPGHKWEYTNRNSTSVKCVAAPGRVKPKSQQARGRERNAECDPSWAHHYYGQGTHDTAGIIVKTVTRLSTSEFRSTNPHFLHCLTLVCPVSTQPSLSLPNCWDRNQPPAAQWLTFMLSNKPGSCTSSNTIFHQLFGLKQLAKRTFMPFGKLVI